jgi:hypothetical protein
MKKINRTIKTNGNVTKAYRLNVPKGIICHTEPICTK